jgi:peptidyl-prolyl cis-trans isomerase C
MKQRLAGALFGLGVLAAAALAHGSGTSVIATIGDYKLDVDAVEARMRQVPLFQVKNLGSSPDEIRRKFVDEVVALELMVQGARIDKLDEQPEVKERLRAVLVSALLNELVGEATRAGEIGDDQVKAYYEANKARYQPELRIKIWQIAVASREKAAELLDTIKNGAEFKDEASFATAWDKLVQEHSIDRSTKMQKGNLGFVQPDGTTAQEDIRVPKEMFEAAAKIKDGEIYPEPLQLGGYWIVLARRGSHMTPERPLSVEAPAIRQLLAREHVANRRKQLVDGLREKYVRDVNDKPIDQISVSDSDITVERRPGALRRAQPASGDPKPKGEPGNMR